jgi:hypothetical protein
VTSCGSSSEGSTAPTTERPSTSEAAPPPTSAPSDRPQSEDFVAEQPDEAAIGLYLGFADLILSDTPWTIDAMGSQSWIAMLTEGALVACEAYHDGASTAEAMQSTISVSPLEARVPSADDIDAYDLMSAYLIGGIDAYCPTLIETMFGSVFNTGLDAAWEELTGGPAPERPIRLPDLSPTLTPAPGD